MMVDVTVSCHTKVVFVVFRVVYCLEPLNHSGIFPVGLESPVLSLTATGPQETTAYTLQSTT